MAHPVRRYWVKIGQDALQIRTQGQTAAGGYFTTGSKALSTKGKSKSERRAAIEAVLLSMTPVQDMQG